MIKRLLHPGKYGLKINLALLFLRISVGIFMFTHGWGKMMKLFSDGAVKFADPLGIGAFASLSLVVFAEIFCSFLLIIGLFTRFASIPLMITMFVAAFVIHADDPFSGKEMALLYLVIYLVLFITGAGLFSVDRFIYNKSEK